MKKKILFLALGAFAICFAAATTFATTDQGSQKCYKPEGGQCYYSTSSNCPCG